MIEKLETPKHINWDDTPEGLIQRHRLITYAYEKINELRDAVNVLQAQVAILEEHAHPTAKTPVDPYEEQRKWIGKICKFWNWDTGLAHYSKLITIKDINDGEMSNCPFRADDGGWYMYCEPVKPDDDIIYKGE